MEAISVQVKVTGAVNARYQLTEQSSTHLLCYAANTGFGDSYGVVMWFGGFGKLPNLSIDRQHRHGPTRNISLARSTALSVNFVRPGGAGWSAGYQYFTDGRRIHFGSGTVTANPALTKGQLHATLVWDHEGPHVRPIHITASWDCTRHISR